MRDVQSWPTAEILTARIADLVLAKRKESSSSRSAFGRRLGITRQRVKSIEDGKAHLYLHEIALLMSKLSIKPDEIWTEFSKLNARLYEVNAAVDGRDKFYLLVNLVEDRDNK